MDSSAPADSNPAPAAEDRLGPTLMRVAWLSILLGIGIQLAMLVTFLLLGKDTSWGSQLADAAKSVSWATLVCVGVAVGRAIPGARVAGMGLMGLLSGPIAFNVARAVHRGVGESLKVAPAAAPVLVPDPLVMGLVKGLEYGFLGALLGAVSRRSGGRLAPHVFSGLAVGAVFGGLVFALTNSVSVKATGAALGLDKGLPIFINETLFPMGCAIVLYSTDLIRRRMG